MTLSFVIPVYNEEQSLEELYDTIVEVVRSEFLGEIEIIFVDDGSVDGSWETISWLRNKDPGVVRGVRLRRNLGKATGLSHGFKRVKGDIVITMDADLQDDPREIPRFIQKIKEGYDLVSGWKQNRKDSFVKNLSSKFFNFITCLMSGMKLHDFNCGFKAYRREALENLNLYGEHHRFIPFLVNEGGFRVTEIPIIHHPRKHGKSKYGWDRFFKGAIDLLTVISTTRYLQRPAHLLGGMGLLFGIIGSGLLGYLSLMKWIMDQSIEGRPLFFLGILLVILSAQLVSFGIIAEMIYRLLSNKEPVKSQVLEEI